MMAKKIKFTFKLKPKEKGLAAVANPLQDCDIKLNGLVIGQIQSPNWSSKDRKYTTNIAVKSTTESNPNRKWRWVRLTKQTDSLDEMKTWLNSVAGVIVEKYELHSFEA